MHRCSRELQSRESLSHVLASSWVSYDLIFQPLPCVGHPRPEADRLTFLVTIYHGIQGNRHAWTRRGSVLCYDWTGFPEISRIMRKALLPENPMSADRLNPCICGRCHRTRHTRRAHTSVPWYIWAERLRLHPHRSVAVGCCVAPIIARHFWTPAHMAIYASGNAGMSDVSRPHRYLRPICVCGAAAQASVTYSVCALRWVCSGGWGGVAMLTLHV